ncbi:MAG TPA: hypothetical protein VFI29_01640 [Hanamia sp.]|nr:hypothetical protein [Hanamia sp.]
MSQTDSFEKSSDGSGKISKGYKVAKAIRKSFVFQGQKNIVEQQPQQKTGVTENPKE